MARKTEGGRLIYADLLRAFAAFGVVVLHVAASRIMAVPVTSRDWQVFNLCDGLVRWCVPVFVMLSGMFMLDPDRAQPLSKLLFHNVLRILVCLFFYGTLYAVVLRLLEGGGLTWGGVWNAFLTVLQGNARYHLWFLYMILGLYLITPFLRGMCRGATRGELLWFLGVAFLFASLLPMAFDLWPGATASLERWYDQMKVQSVMGYVGYFVAGYYLKAYTLSRIAEALTYALGVAGAVWTVWGTRLASLRAGAMVERFYSSFAPNVVLFSVAVVVLFRYVLGVSDERSRKQRLVGVAKITFGIYLIHDFFLIALEELEISVLSFSSVLSVPLLSCAVFLCSLAVAWLLSKIPVVGRWLT